MNEQKFGRTQYLNALLNMVQGTATRSDPPQPSDDDMILSAALRELDEKDWHVYVPGMLQRGEWVSAWDSVAEEPFFGEFQPDTSSKGYGDFVADNGERIGEEVVTHIMRVKPPEGQRGHWE